MPSYFDYALADSVPVLAVFFILQFIVFPSVLCFGKGGRGSDGVLGFVRLTLRHLFDRRGNSLVVHNREFRSSILTYWLFGFVLSLSTLAFAVFWDVLLVERSYTCNPGLNGLDCFDANNGTYVDCFKYDNTTQTVLICFRYVFNYGQAMSAAGGMFMFGGLFMTLLSFLTIWVYDMCANRSIAILVIIASQVFACVSTLTVLGVTTFVPSISDIAYKDVPSFAQYITLSCTLLWAIGMPWYLLPRGTDPSLQPLVN